MDPLTHAASGAVAMLAITRRPATRWAAPVAAIACAFPDIDLAFIRTPLQFLELHRGITHSFAGAPFFALIPALLAWPLWRRSTPDRWPFAKVWLFCAGMILLHIWLDVVTTYGTMVFLPFSHYRVRLNSIYIIDPLVTAPLLWAIWRWRARPALLAAAMIWVFAYSAIGTGINAWHTAQWRDRLLADNRDIQGLTVLPDAFAPFFWRVLYEEKEDAGYLVKEQSINALGRARAPAEGEPAAPVALTRKIAAGSIAGNAYFNFALLPVMRDARPADRPEGCPDSARLLLFYDLRFGSGLRFVRELLALRPNADIPFQLMAELVPPKGSRTDSLAGMGVERIRLRFSDSGCDSGWHRPLAPREPAFWQWLAGLE